MRRRIRRSLRPWGWKLDVADEVDSELGFHIEMRTRELIAKGMDPARARATAIERFGDLHQVHTTLEKIGRRRDRRDRRTEWLSELHQDVVYATRQLRRNRAFALLTILTLGDNLAGARFNTVLLSVLGVIGLVLATVGIFGVISYFVSQRTQEIGIRMALGATPRRVLVLIVEQGLRPVVVGVVLGLIGTAAATRVLQTLLFDVSATDPLTLIGVASGVTAIAVLAALVPARRATRIDPLAALRE